MDNQDIDALMRVIPKLVHDPTLLSDPLINFFCDYIESLGGKIPESAWNTEAMGDPSVEVTDENRNASQEAEIQAMEAISEDKLEEAVDLLTMAILLNPKSAIMYETRASVYIKMKKPNAAIRDAIAALKINPDSAKGNKSRGIARAMLGQWEEAAKDLHRASKLDHDEEISVVLDKAWSNAQKVEEHQRKYERLRREEKYKAIEREQVRRRFKARAAYLKAKKQEQPSSSGSQGGPPGEFIDYNKILNDPDLMAAFKDLEVTVALLDVMTNPASLAKHQANPKVAAVIATILSKFVGPN
ncbi:FAM10 family protein [Abeliophyllum distichum]|uniref:FAM10 family protein n=1 Tax=Abeliophyllum distichum TaxID=126358 RepID=A0ABD1TDW8_9LAMI